jgi:hypothetical protein
VENRCQCRQAAAVGQLAYTVFLAEFVHTSAGIDDFLLARIKRVARGAHLNKEILAERRARIELVATTTSYLDVVVIRMNIGFHVLALRSALLHKKGA